MKTCKQCGIKFEGRLCPNCNTFNKCFLALALSLLLPSLVFASYCDDVQTNLTIGKPVWYNASNCPIALGIYYVNATSSSTGAITIGASNVVLDCNGASLIGNGTGRGITRSSFWSNVTIQNCNIYNYSTGIETSGSNQNWNITNNNIYFKSITGNAGIVFRNLGNTTISYNNIIGDNESAENSYGIRITGITELSNNNIYGNRFLYMGYGVRVEGSSNQTNIFNNYFQNVTNPTFNKDNATYMNVYDNIMNDTGNAVEFTTNYSNAYRNYVLNNKHNCLDVNAQHYNKAISNINFINNTCIWTKYIFNCGGVYANNVTNINITGNIFINTPDNNAISIADYSGNVMVYNNSLDNSITSTAPCLALQNSYIDSLNSAYTLFYNNNFKNCNGRQIRFSTDVGGSVRNAFAQVYNNTYEDSTVSFSIGTDNHNFTYVENITQFLTINDSNKNAYVYLNWQGMKNISMVSHIITINSCDSGNCSINFNNGTIINNVNTATFPVISNQRVDIVKSSASGGCNYPYDNYTISTSGLYRFCNQSYNFNDVEKNGVIILNSDNVTIDCLGGFLIGSQKYLSRAINISTRNNITIQNCNIYNFTNGIRGQGSYLATDNNGIYLYNNSFKYNYKSIYMQGADNVFIQNNYFYETNDSASLAGYDTAQIAAYGTAKNISIKNNYFNSLGSAAFGATISYYDNINVSNNYFYNADRGVMIQADTNSIIDNNYFENMTYNEDFYMTAIHIFQSIYTDPTKISENITISNNQIVNAGSVGILVQGRNKWVTIKNNDIDLVSWVDKQARKYKYGTSVTLDIQDAGDTACGIEVGAVFKGFTTDGEENTFTDKYAKIHNYTSDNVNISGNVFSSDVDCLLWVQANTTQITTITNDLTNYWFRKLNPQPEFIDDFYFYISNNADTLYRYCPACTGNRDVTNLLYFGYGTNSGDATRRYNYSISKTLMTFTNVNLTTAYNLSLFNLTDQGYQYSQIFLSNQTSPISENENERNVTIPPNNRTIVLNYLTSTQPRYLTIDTTIQTVSNIDYNGNTASFSIYGPGLVTINTTSIQGNKGAFMIYRNGVFVDYVANSTYSFSEGSYDLILSQKNVEFYNEVVKPMNNGLLVFVSGMSLIILAIIGSAIFGFWKSQKDNQQLELVKLIKNIGIVVIIMIILMLGVTMLSLIANYV